MAEVTRRAHLRSKMVYFRRGRAPPIQRSTILSYHITVCTSTTCLRKTFLLRPALLRLHAELEAAGLHAHRAIKSPANDMHVLLYCSLTVFRAKEQVLAHTRGLGTWVGEPAKRTDYLNLPAAMFVPGTPLLYACAARLPHGFRIRSRYNFKLSLLV